jgi:hypothetical protein
MIQTKPEQYHAAISPNIFDAYADTNFLLPLAPDVRIVVASNMYVIGATTILTSGETKRQIR